GSILYELHLRYLNQAMRYTGFPYAYHTVGSSFAVRASAYVKQGGMNKRKAGEDFHFLHKIIPLGDYVEINTTRVIPSPRISDRVPFGTGASMRRWMNDGEQALYTYPIEPFRDLKELFSLIPEFYRSDINNMASIGASLPDPLMDFLKQNNYVYHIDIAKQNSASLETFTKRFFGWFGGLQIVKYLNYSCLGHYEKQPADKAALSLLLLSGHKNLPVHPRDLLFAYRKLERKIT
ncbi:MAG: glycosyltransferase family 2 protein, partial [Bacteroidales bacterium]|nr:glycosyltransferase family 2 protein [Bacteroidales bacterium]